MAKYMKNNYTKEWTDLEQQIKNSYESSVTIEEAEKLAARFLGAQMQAANILRSFDLDARMRKSGLKALKASVYMDAATSSDKKPSDVLLQNLVDQDKIVQSSQESFDEAEVQKDYIQNYFNVFREAHIFFRGIAKGRFE